MDTWIEPKTEEIFKKVGCNVSFKSPRNLNSILTSRNKPKLSPNSHPGVYFIPSSCNKGYTGETKKRVNTRNIEHQKAVFKGDVCNDALAEHDQSCKCTIQWEKNNKTGNRTNIL